MGRKRVQPGSVRGSSSDHLRRRRAQDKNNEKNNNKDANNDKNNKDSRETPVPSVAATTELPTLQPPVPTATVITTVQPTTSPTSKAPSRMPTVAPALILTTHEPSTVQPTSSPTSKAPSRKPSSKPTEAPSSIVLTQAPSTGEEVTPVLIDNDDRFFVAFSLWDSSGVISLEAQKEATVMILRNTLCDKGMEFVASRLTMESQCPHRTSLVRRLEDDPPIKFVNEEDGQTILLWDTRQVQVTPKLLSLEQGQPQNADEIEYAEWSFAWPILQQGSLETDEGQSIVDRAIVAGEWDDIFPWETLVPSVLGQESDAFGYGISTGSTTAMSPLEIRHDPLLVGSFRRLQGCGIGLILVNTLALLFLRQKMQKHQTTEENNRQRSDGQKSMTNGPLSLESPAEVDRLLYRSTPTIVITPHRKRPHRPRTMHHSPPQQRKSMHPPYASVYESPTTTLTKPRTNHNNSTIPSDDLHFITPPRCGTIKKKDQTPSDDDSDQSSFQSPAVASPPSGDRSFYGTSSIQRQYHPSSPIPEPTKRTAIPNHGSRTQNKNNDKNSKENHTILDSIKRLAIDSFAAPALTPSSRSRRGVHSPFGSM